MGYTGGLLFVGNPDPAHVGNHFAFAARSLGLSHRLVDSRLAYQGPYPFPQLAWKCAGRRPWRLSRFSSDLAAQCRESATEMMLTTGVAPVNSQALREIGKLGIQRFNFLTDDPWNQAHRAPWFLDALRHYDRIFSPRRANLEELRRHGCAAVEYLPFGYSPEIHFPEGEAEGPDASEVVFVGGGDADRVPYMAALAQAGIKLALYGGYWDRFPETKRYAFGHVSPAQVRTVCAGAKVHLCLVRKSNRDGHSMRSYELAAMGCCVVAEETEDHRELFGADGEAAEYFTSLPEMVAKVSGLLRDSARRARLRQRVLERVAGGGNEYKHRLLSILRASRWRNGDFQVAPELVPDQQAAVPSVHS